MIHKLINIIEHAGKHILALYDQSITQVNYKKDHSPLTQADLTSHTLILHSLKTLFSSVPIISEESEKLYPYDIRKHWEYYFLVDPLDGTKEFLQRNGQFTVNIALMKNKKPILGVLHAPALNVTYYAEKGKGAYKMVNHATIKLFPTAPKDELRIVMSRAHGCTKTQTFLNALVARGKTITVDSIGSALKFGLIAEGSADIYPRFGPTMEWDTAAGQIIVTEVGKKVMLLDESSELLYNKVQLVNPGFIVQ